MTYGTYVVKWRKSPDVDGYPEREDGKLSSTMTGQVPEGRSLSDGSTRVVVSLGKGVRVLKRHLRVRQT